MLIFNLSKLAPINISAGFYKLDQNACFVEDVSSMMLINGMTSLAQSKVLSQGAYMG